MKSHPSEVTLALYATGDLDLRERLSTAWHVRTCGRCGEVAKAFQQDLALRREGAAAMPLPADWDSLAEEMAANIRVGLEASECIRDRKPVAAGNVRPKLAPHVRPDWFWKPTLGIAMAMTAIVAVWIGNMPPEQTRVFGKVWDVAVHGRNVADAPVGIVLESSSNGIEMRSGSRTSLKVLVEGRKPEQISANLDGSVRAQYVDEDSGQVTVTNVYSQQ